MPQTEDDYEWWVTWVIEEDQRQLRELSELEDPFEPDPPTPSPSYEPWDESPSPLPIDAGRHFFDDAAYLV